MGSARVVGYGSTGIVPRLPVAIESTVSMTLKADILAAEYPRRGLILVSNRQGMIEPV